MIHDKNMSLADIAREASPKKTGKKESHFELTMVGVLIFSIGLGYYDSLVKLRDSNVKRSKQTAYKSFALNAIDQFENNEAECTEEVFYLNPPENEEGGAVSKQHRGKIYHASVPTNAPGTAMEMDAIKLDNEHFPSNYKLHLRTTFNGVQIDYFVAEERFADISKSLVFSKVKETEECNARASPIVPARQCAPEEMDYGRQAMDAVTGATKL